MSTGLTNIIAKPSYLTELPKDDLSDMKKFMSPPRLKIIQGQTGAPFKPQYRDGDCIIVPQMLQVGSMENEFVFTVVHFFPTWVCSNPWEMKETLRFIREMSFDEDSEIAKKARAFVSEPCPENKKYNLKYSQVMNFLIRFNNPTIALPDSPVTMILNRGEFNSGRVLIDLIEKRDAPRYVSQFNAISVFRPGKKGNWYGLNFRNSPEPWVAEEKVEIYRKEHEFLRELVANRQIQIDMDDSDVENGGGAAEETKF